MGLIYSAHPQDLQGWFGGSSLSCGARRSGPQRVSLEDRICFVPGLGRDVEEGSLLLIGLEQWENEGLAWVSVESLACAWYGGHLEGFV